MDGNGGRDLFRILFDMGGAYLWFIALAVWGGTVSYISRVRHNKSAFSIVELVGEWTVSGFAGLLAAYICNEMGLSFGMTAAAAGIAGHMGGRAIYIIEQKMLSKIGLKNEEDSKK
jgi:hypothetical protein